MSFEDEAVEPHRPTLLLWKCKRCSELVTEAHPDVNVTLRRALETSDMLRVHGCSDGADGVAELIGTGPGRPPQSRAA